METLTVEEAYAAMYAFLDHLYESTKSDDLGAFLGAMSILEDGKPADSAIWKHWLEAVKKAKSGDVDVSLGL